MTHQFAARRNDTPWWKRPGRENSVYLTAILMALIAMTAGGMIFHAPAVAAEETVLHIGTVNPPTSLNFFGATDLPSRRILRLFHMPLYVRGPKGDRAQPWLAAGPPQKGSTTPHEILITLKDAEWDDGTPVTAQDLVFTIRVIQEFKVPGLMEKWRDVKDMAVIDPKTIRFVLSRPSPDFFSRALRTGFVQKKAWQNVVHTARDAKDGLKVLLTHTPVHVLSNGPFYLSTNGMPYFLVLKKNPFFFGDRLNINGIQKDFSLQGITVHFYQSYRNMLREFKKGQIEFLWADLTERQVREIEEDHVAVHRTPRTGYDYLGFNLKRKPFDDSAFRKAVSLLVDRESIIQHTLMGRGEPVVAVIPPYNRAWHNAEIAWAGANLDPDKRVSKARALLRHAGYGWDQGRLLLPEGKRMEATRKDVYRGWVALPGGVGNLWSFLNIKPTE